jgi:hypothetical protein
MSSTQQLLLGEGAGGAAPNYIEEVFSTYLYTGNSTSGGTQSITNNIDLSTKGGMVWIKGRSAASDHILTDTTRGAGTTASNNQALSSNLTTAEDLGASYDFLSAFNTTGFAVTQGGSTAATRGTNYNNVTYASWTFRKQPKFFDVVTWTGNGSNPRTIAHNLGSVPACIIVKETNTSSSWAVWHRSLGDGYRIFLNNTNASTNISAADWFGTSNSTITSTGFSVGSNLNTNGRTLVAYIFAHDAGGFGLTGTDNVISCGSYTTDGSGNATVTLGYEPQWIMVKVSSGSSNWDMYDNMRGIVTGGNDAVLRANLSNAEISADTTSLTATGFTFTGSADATYIYIAIRRGPMKVPTSGTSVFFPATVTESGNTVVTTTGFPVDTLLTSDRAGNAKNAAFGNRLTNANSLTSSSTRAELSVDFYTGGLWDSNTTSTGNLLGSGNTIKYFLRRAPSFFDVVCYTGAGSSVQTFNHNLTVTPELIISKRRSGAQNWFALNPAMGYDSCVFPNLTDAKLNFGTTIWSATSTTMTLNASALLYPDNYVAYLFATCAGVSKVGSYTGTGTTKQVDCGFTAGARFVLIKRADASGDWYVWDTARGIVSGNDPYLLLNSTAAEVTNTDYIDTYSAGFEISSTAPAAINASGGTFIFLAIA